MKLFFITDAWGYTKGGINTINTELCKALTRSDLDIFCVVINASSEDIADAKNNRVTLINLIKNNDHFEESDHYRIYYEIKKYIKRDNVWTIGHDVLTGRIAISVKKLGESENVKINCGIIHHMSYADYAAYKNINTASDKVREQENLLSKADVLFAIGPRLKKAISKLNCNVHELIPGIDNGNSIEIKSAISKDNFDIVVLGRLSKEDDIIKRASLVVKTFASLVKDGMLGNQPRLSLIGANNEDVQKLQEEAQSIANRENVTINPFSYTSERTQLFKELSRKNICIMPSLEEGFGLAAWEAIGLGVPVIISQKSGLYDFFKNHPDYKGFITDIDVTGKDSDIENLKKKIIEIYNDYSQYKENAIDLQKKLCKEFTWNKMTDNFVRILNEYESKSHEIDNNLASSQNNSVEDIIDEAFKLSVRDLIIKDMVEHNSNLNIKYHDNITFKENCNLWIAENSSIPEYSLVKMAEDARRAAFNEKYGNYNYNKDLRGKYKAIWWECIRQFVDSKNKEGCKIVCVGGNSGDELVEIFGEAPKAKLIVVDISNIAIEKGKQNYGKKIKFEQGSMEGTTLDRTSYDMYLNLRSIHSRGVDIRTALSECYRLLKSNGVAIFSVANGYLSNRGDNEDIVGMYDNYLGFLSQKKPYDIVGKIRGKLEDYGFNEIEVHTGKSEIFIKAIKP